MLKKGLYEQVIYKQLSQELEQATDFIKDIAPIDKEEASKILAKYLTRIIEKSLDNVKHGKEDIEKQIDLVNKIIQTIVTETKDEEFGELSVDEPARQLWALFDKKNAINAVNENIQTSRPQTSIAQSSLFTGAVHEPSLATELKKEILTADRIDMLVSFIKWSGLRLIIDELREYTSRGGKLRIITTSYMGATDFKAIEELHRLPNTEIKVSYDTKRTRLHAKTYVFYRDTGFTTAYIGSSNLSNAAMSSGLEWNVKVTAQDLPETICKIDATFESYWNSNRV
jgi:HKD family nuclease/gas vesicle protein